jgi:hypothetical protein
MSQYAKISLFNYGSYEFEWYYCTQYGKEMSFMESETSLPFSYETIWILLKPPESSPNFYTI